MDEEQQRALNAIQARHWVSSKPIPKRFKGLANQGSSDIRALLSEARRKLNPQTDKAFMAEMGVRWDD